MSITSTNSNISDSICFLRKISAGVGDYVAADVNFGFLKANGVSFYDTSLASPPPAPPATAAPVPLPTLPTFSTEGLVRSS